MAQKTTSGGGAAAAAATGALAAAREALAKPLDFETFLTKLGPRGRVHAERHVATADAEPEHGPRHAEVWQRLARSLISLASHAAKINGQQSVQIYIADGKYKMQVFALEDLRDGSIHVFCSNVLDDAMKQGVVGTRKREEKGPLAFQIPSTDDWLTVEELDGSTANPAPFYKDMLGWNRKAVRVTIPKNATDAQITAVEAFCALSARAWINNPKPAV